jgi:ComF family protein
MPKTDLSDFSQNQAALRFYGKISFEKAAAGFHYVKESPVQEVLELIKYKGLKELGQYLGSYLAGKLDNAHFFDDMDELVPVPLHRQKMKQRGYNQSEWIAKGISALTQLPVNTENLIRTSHNPSQTKKQVYERWENVASLFTLKQPAMFENKHLLLIDDVLTTGATLEACAHAIQEASGARVSFFALALA